MPSSAWTLSRCSTTTLGTDLLRFAAATRPAGRGLRGLGARRGARGVGVEDGYVDTIGWLCVEVREVARRAAQDRCDWAELCELLPETGAAWREGRITTTAVELIAAARVPDCDAELVAVEAEFLDRAQRGDHKSLRMLDDPFPACARADGSKPDQPDGVTVADVGDRGVLRGDFAKPASRRSATPSRRSPDHRRANDESTLARAAGRGARCGSVRSPSGVGPTPTVPGPSCRYLTQERTPDESHPMMMGVFAGVIDPRERERILCDAVIVPVTTDRLGRDPRPGPATTRSGTGPPAGPSPPEPALSVAGM